MSDIEKLLKDMKGKGEIRFYEMVDENIAKIIMRMEDNYEQIDVLEAEKISELGFYMTGVFLYPYSKDVIVYLQRRIV